MLPSCRVHCSRRPQPFTSVSTHVTAPRAMSLWARVNQLPPPVLEQIRYIYGNSFPIEVRHYLAEWIEDRLL